MIIDVNASGYTGQFVALNRLHQLPVSRLAIAHAIALVGKENWRSAFVNIFDAVSNGLRAFADLKATPAGMALRPDFAQRDQSEKTACSYRLGMGITKVVMDRLFGLRCLLHVDRMVATGTALLQPSSKCRGDLAGQDRQGQWHVVEAKARSGAWASHVASTGKSQAQRVATINGAPPATQSVSAIWLGRIPVRVELADPEGSYDLAINEAAMCRMQLKPFVEAVGEGRRTRVTIAGTDFELASLRVQKGHRRFRIGVARSVLDAWESEEISRRLRDFEPRTSEDEDVDVSSIGTVMIEESVLLETRRLRRVRLI